MTTPYPLKELHTNPYETQEEYRTLFEQAPDAVVAIDEFNRVIFWNPKAEEIFGWSVEEAIGSSLSNLIIPQAYRSAHDSGMKRYLATGEVRVLNRTIEVPAMNRSGKEFFIALTIARTNLKEKTAFLAFIRDITEQFRNREALEQKTKELERSNQNLEEFAHAASHDLKEPVRKIQFFTERLKEGLRDQLNEDNERSLDRIGSAIQRMAALIDDLLLYSHASQRPLEMEMVDLNKKVRKVLEDLELDIEEKKAVIDISHLPAVKGYRRQLQQLFQNLISNALKYSRHGVPPHIHITASEVSEEGKSYCRIEVRDNGIGFEQQYADKIFQMFTRLHGKGEYSGTGVGLSIVKKVVENHSGFIRVESSPGEGAAFTVYLPLE